MKKLAPQRKEQRKRFIIATVAIALGLSTLLGAFVLKYGPTDLSAVLPSIVTLLTNNARREAHLKDLKPNAELAQAAQMKADDMAAKGYFSHIGPDGMKPWQWIDKTDYVYQYAGENLAVNYGESEELVTAWLDSPKHRANILGEHYTDIGIGMATGTYKGMPAEFIVQFFASPAK